MQLRALLPILALAACDGMTTRLDAGTTDTTTGDAGTSAGGDTGGDTGTNTNAGDTGTTNNPDAGTSAGSDAGAAGTFAEYARRSTAAFCWQIDHCPFADDDAIGQHLLFTSAAPVTCETWAGRVMDSTRLQRAIAAGKIVFDEAAAQRCLAAIGTTCTNLDRSTALVPACREALRGQVQPGAGCTQNQECAGGWCDFIQDTSCGRCRAGNALGAQCDRDEQCSDAMLTGGSPWCLANRCVEVKSAVATGVGQPCGLTSVVQSRVTFTTCPPELYCSTNARDEMGACLRPTMAGAACDNDNVPCEGINLCERPAGGGPRACLALTVRTRPGEACNEQAFVFCNPLLRLTCQGGICASIGDATEGASCRTGDYSELDCGAGLYCDRDMRRCARTKADGDTCESSRECTSHQCVTTRSGDPARCGYPTCQ